MGTAIFMALALLLCWLCFDLGQKYEREMLRNRQCFHGWVRYFDGGKRREYKSLLQAGEDKKQGWIPVFGRPPKDRE